MLSLAALPWAAARRHGASTALRSGPKSLTHAQLDRAAAGVAARLARAGVSAGARVAILCGNGLAFPAAYYGALRLGAVVAPLSTASPVAELAAALRALRVSLLLSDAEHAWAGAAALHAAATGAAQLIVDEAGPAARDRLVLATLVEHPPADPAPVPGHSPAVVLATSGTTGVPRRAVHSHAGLLLNARAVAIEMLSLEPGDVQLGALPLAHSFGMSAVLNASVLAGSETVLMPRFDAEVAARLLDEAGVSVVQGVPTMLDRLAGVTAQPPASLRRVVVSGAPLPPGLAALVHERLCTDVVERYGMTECSPLTVRRVPHDGGTPGDVGDPLAGVVVRVIGGAEEGELEVAAPGMFLGYDRDRRATAAALVGGLLRTGDIGRVARDGRVRLVGRLKEIIVRGGNNVAPAEVERVLEAHPAVCEAAVLGVPDADLGERVVAAVVTRPGRGGDHLVEELRAACVERLAAYKVPQDWRIVGSLPRTATGKLRRAEVRSLFQPSQPRPPGGSSPAAAPGARKSRDEAVLSGCDDPA